MPEAPPVPRKGLADLVAEAAEPIFAQQATNTPPPVVAPVAAAAAGAAAAEEPVEIGGVKLEMPGEIKSESGRKSWRFYKDEVKKTVGGLNTRIKELEERVEKAGVNQAGELQKKLDVLQQERDELSTALGQTNLERTPEFQKHYVTGESQIIKDATSLVPKEHSDRLAHVMAMPEGETRTNQLEAILESLPTLQQTELAVALRDLRNIRRERTEKLADWKSQLAQRDQVYGERTKAQQAAMTQTFDTRLAALRDNPLFKPREGDAAFNAELEKAVIAARGYYEGKGSPEERANAALYAASHPTLMRQLISQQQELEKLTKTLEGQRAKVPTPGAGPDAGQAGREVKPLGKPENMAERMARIARESGYVK